MKEEKHQPWVWDRAPKNQSEIAHWILCKYGSICVLKEEEFEFRANPNDPRDWILQFLEWREKRRKGNAGV